MPGTCFESKQNRGAVVPDGEDQGPGLIEAVGDGAAFFAFVAALLVWLVLV